MAKLYFKVASDWEEVVRLRNEIARLKHELKGMDSTQSPAAFKSLNTQLSASTQRMDELVTKAAHVGAVMEGNFKRKIFDASQTVNGFTEKIIAQKNAIKGFEQDLRALQEEYRKITKNGGKSQDGLDRIHRMKNIIAEEKDALFNLTQQQANARLSVKKLRDEYALYKNDGKQVIETNKGIGLSLGKALGVIGGVTALKQLGSEIIRVRGEFQSMQTAIETMVGKDMAGQLIPQIKELAKISPLTMSDMVGAEKMMLGFNIQAEDTIKYLKALSDISMGESGKFNSLTLAFSQMSAAGRLLGGDLNQMINAGFNPLQIIAEKTGKSIATLKEEMSKGAVSAEMVQQAFMDATSAGGKFYGMSENASKTINGQISMMQDAWDNALNEIGKSSEGFIMSGIQATTSLIQNYETIGKILVGMIATYGVYKTALIANITLTRGWAVAARADAVAKGIQTIATKAQTVAQLALNSAMKANPYVLVATLIMGAVSAMWAFHDSTTAAEKAQKRFNDEQERFNKQQEDRKQKIEQLIRIIQDETETEYAKVKAYEELNTLSPALTEAYTREKLAVASLTSTNKKLNEEQDKQNYDNIISNVNKYTEILNKARAEAERLRNEAKNTNDMDKASVLNNSAFGQELAAAKAERDLQQWMKQLNDYNRIRKEIEESSKPLEVRLNAAKENEKNIKEALEIIDELILTKKREVEGHEIKVPLSSEDAAQEAESLEDKVKALKAKVEGDDIKIPFKPNEYLNNIPSLFEQEKDNWVNMGLFTIPVNIELERNKITGLLSDAQKAVSALTGNSTQTYKEAYELAKKEWIAAKKALEESKKKSKDDYDKAKKELAVKEKAYKDLGGVTDKELKKQESVAEKQKKEQEKYKLLIDKQNREQERMKIDSLHELEQVEINSLEEGSEKVLRQRKLNHEKELEQIKREVEDKKLKEIEKARIAFEANPDNKKKTFSAEEFVTSEPAKKQFAVFDKVVEAKTKNADIKYNRGDDLKGLLSEYQDYTDKRLAIERKFNEDIAVLQEQRKLAVESGDTPQVEQIDRSIAQATKNKGMELMSLDYDKLKESPEYIRAFENLKETSTETLNSLLSQFENAKQTAAQVLSPDQLREYTTTIQEIMDELDSRNPFQTLAARKKELAEAEKELANAQRNLNKVNAGENVISGTRYNNKTGKIETIYLSATQALDNYNKAKDRTVKADSKVQAAEKKVSDVVNRLAKSIDDVGSAIGGQAGEILGIISDIGTFAMSAMSGIETASQTASAAVKAVESASVILMIISTAIQIATKIANMFSSNKEEERKRYIDQLNAMIDIYERIIEKQKESIKFGYGFSAITSAKKAMEELNNKTEQYRKIAQSAGSSKDSLSKDYMGRLDEMLNDVKPISFEVKLSSLTSIDTSDFSKFTAKQLLYIRDNYKDIWSALNEEQRNALQAIIDAEEESKEIVDAWKESITGISYDNLYSEFIDTLSDMDSSAEDMANNFGEYLRKSILAAMVANEFKDEIDNLYEMWINAGDDKSEGGTDITTDESQLIQERQKEIVEAMTKRREEMEKAYGWNTSSNSSQDSTKKGFQAMSQDTGEELNGRFTALQIAGEEIKNQSITQTGLLSSINDKMSFLDLTNEDIPQLAASAPDIAGPAKEIITNSYQPQVNVVFPDAKLDVLTVEVSTMKNIVNEMRTLQVEGNLDTQEIREGIQIISKNSPKVLANMDELKRGIKNVL